MDLISRIFGLVRIISRIGKYRDVELTNIREGLETGELQIGDNIRMIGSYSEFVPFVSMTKIVTIRTGQKMDSPKPNSVIKTGDVLIASGYAEGVEDLQRMVST